MSWQAYVDSSLVGSGHVDKACIISAAGDSIWAQSSGFSPSADELKAIAAIMDDAEKGDGPAKEKAFAEGVHIGGVRYVAARVEGRSAYVRTGRNGIAIVKTKQAILLGHHGEEQVAGNTSSTVESLADYLIGQGY